MRNTLLALLAGLTTTLAIADGPPGQDRNRQIQRGNNGQVSQQIGSISYSSKSSERRLIGPFMHPVMGDRRTSTSESSGRLEIFKDGGVRESGRSSERSRGPQRICHQVGKVTYCY